MCLTSSWYVLDAAWRYLVEIDLLLNIDLSKLLNTLYDVFSALRVVFLVFDGL